MADTLSWQEFRNSQILAKKERQHKTKKQHTPCWPLRAFTDHRFLKKFHICMNHLLSLTCSCWFCRAEIVTTKGHSNFQFAKHFTFMTSLNGTTAWYLLPATLHSWGNGGSEWEVELAPTAALKDDALRPESGNTWPGAIVCSLASSYRAEFDPLGADVEVTPNFPTTLRRGS